MQILRGQGACIAMGGGHDHGLDAGLSGGDGDKEQQLNQAGTSSEKPPIDPLDTNNALAANPSRRPRSKRERKGSVRSYPHLVDMDGTDERAHKVARSNRGGRSGATQSRSRTSDQNNSG